MLTRRGFIERIAAAGGTSLAYEAMTGLGLIPLTSTTSFDLHAASGGRRVVIVGAGLAGMTVAYELGKLGYVCHVLEARDRPGGRAHTIRRGTVSEEDGASQTCRFDDEQYFNCGAMRVAYHHTTTLAYCRELHVPVETFAQISEAAYLYQTKTATLAGQRVRVREVHADLDGYTSELLSKVAGDHALEEAVTNEDRERLLEYLRTRGALDTTGRYVGAARRGGGAPLALNDLLGSRTGYYLDAGFQYQETMMQIVGGTDRLPRALAARLRNQVTYRAAVREIRQTERGVAIGYTDAAGRPQKVEGEYAVCAIPLPLLASIDSDLPTGFKADIAAVPYAAAGKIGLQFKRRFWEEDDHIFGGASKTDLDIAQIVYPSSGYLGAKGVLVGYYLQGQGGRRIGDLTPPEREAVALEQGSRIHPQYTREFENGFSVAWHRVTWNRGSWSNTTPAIRKKLSEPQGRVYLAGDHLNMNAWMQGALESAREVAKALHIRASSERPSAEPVEAQV